MLPSTLPHLQRFGDCALLLLRIALGVFLIWGVLDNIVSVARMNEFATFLTRFGFPTPAILAQLSAWAQLLIGLSFITGCYTRWAGLLCMLHFAIAIIMVDRFAGIRGSFGSLCLILVGAYLATHGAGRLSIDTLLERKSGKKL